MYTFLAKPDQIHCLFTGSIASTNYCYGALTIEESVAGSTCTDTLTTVFLLAGRPRYLALAPVAMMRVSASIWLPPLIFNVERTTTKVCFYDRTIAFH